MRRDRAPRVPPVGARSWWLEDALRADPGAPCPPLAGEAAADVCVVGGGFAGLWTAYELTERAPSLDLVVLEADICGAGGSGANGGFFSPSWTILDALCETFGEEDGVRYATALAAQTVELGEWVARHDGADRLPSRGHPVRACGRLAEGGERGDLAPPREAWARGPPARRGRDRGALGRRLAALRRWDGDARSRHRPAGQACPGASPGAARTGRAHLRRHAHGRVRPGAPAVRRDAGGKVAATDVVLTTGAWADRRAPLPPSLHGLYRLHGGDRADTGPSRGDRLAYPHRRRRQPRAVSTCGARTTTASPSAAAPSVPRTAATSAVRRAQLAALISPAVSRRAASPGCSLISRAFVSTPRGAGPWT